MKRSGCLLVAAGLALAGCASSQLDKGRKLLAQEDYAGAVNVLQKALEKDPDSAPLRVDLAEALYHQDELERAQKYLDQARSLDPDSGEAVLLLGLIHEKRGDREQAIAAYRNYTRLSRLSRMRRLIEARLDRLIREQIQEETRKALARESRLEVADAPDNAVAVAPFRNAGANRSLDPLQKGLAEMMVTDLSQVSALQVVERLRMQEMMQEIGLGMTGMVDEATAPRLGKLLGASRVVAGSFADLAEEQLRLDIRVAGVKQEEMESSEARGPLAKLFRLQKELTFGLIEAMGIVLSEEERDAIQEIPTENLLAFIAYSKGLDLEDQGKHQEAATAYQEAVGLDPGFRAAQERMERMEGAGPGAASRRALERQVFRRRRPRWRDMGEGGRKALAERFGQGMTPPLAIPRPGGKLDRLAATGMKTGAGFIPTWEKGQIDLRKPIQERLEELEKITFRRDEAVLEIVVPLEE